MLLLKFKIVFKLIQKLNENKLALFNTLLLLYNTAQLADIRVKLATLYNGLGDFIIMFIVNLSNFSVKIQELLDLFKGEGS